MVKLSEVMSAALLSNHYNYEKCAPRRIRMGVRFNHIDRLAIEKRSNAILMQDNRNSRKSAKRTIYEE